MMKFLTALWKAIQAFLGHLDQAKEQERQATEAKRDAVDKEVDSLPAADLDKRLDKWLRD